MVMKTFFCVLKLSLSLQYKLLNDEEPMAGEQIFPRREKRKSAFASQNFKTDSIFSQGVTKDENL